jgi:hypothetical protein
MGFLNRILGRPPAREAVFTPGGRPPGRRGNGSEYLAEVTGARGYYHRAPLQLSISDVRSVAV